MRIVLCAAILCAVVATGQAAIIGKVTVTAEQAPVMQGKEAVLTAKKGDTFDVSDIKGDWYGVLPSRGWIHKANVKYEAAPLTPPKPVSTQARPGPIWAKIVLDFVPRIISDDMKSMIPVIEKIHRPKPGMKTITFQASVAKERISMRAIIGRYGAGMKLDEVTTTGHQYGPLVFYLDSEDIVSQISAPPELWKAGLWESAEQALQQAGESAAAPVPPTLPSVLSDKGLALRKHLQEFAAIQDEKSLGGAMAILRQEANGAPDALPILVEALGNKSNAVRRQAALLIMSMGQAAKSAEAALEPLLKDLDWNVRICAALALETVAPATPRTWKRILGEGRVFSEEDLRRICLACVARIGSAGGGWNVIATRTVGPAKPAESRVSAAQLFLSYGEPDSTSPDPDRSGFVQYTYGPVTLLASPDKQVFCDILGLPDMIWVMLCDQKKIHSPDGRTILGLPTLVLPNAAGTSAPMGSFSQENPSPRAPSTGPLPPYTSELSGGNEVRIRNPNSFAVKAGIRAGNKGKNLDVPPNGQKSVYIADGRYDIYFVYSTEEDSLFQGDSFTLNGNGVEIQIVKVVGGNYGIRRVK